MTFRNFFYCFCKNEINLWQTSNKGELSHEERLTVVGGGGMAHILVLLCKHEDPTLANFQDSRRTTEHCRRNFWSQHWEGEDRKIPGLPGCLVQPIWCAPGQRETLSLKVGTAFLSGAWNYPIAPHAHMRACPTYMKFPTLLSVHGTLSVDNHRVLYLCKIFLW